MRLHDRSVGISAVFGFFYLISLLFCIQNFQDTLASPTGQPVLQIFVDVFGREGGTAAMSVIIACVTLCGTCSMTSNSRMYYAFSRVSPPSFCRHWAFWPPQRRFLLWSERGERILIPLVPQCTLLDLAGQRYPQVVRLRRQAHANSDPHCLARRRAVVLPGSPCPGQHGSVRRRHLDRDDWTLHLLRHSDRGRSRFRSREVQGGPRSVPPRQVQSSLRHRLYRLRRLHHGHFLSADGDTW